jgi:hypothetical protein
LFCFVFSFNLILFVNQFVLFCFVSFRFVLFNLLLLARLLLIDLSSLSFTFYLCLGSSTTTILTEKTVKTWRELDNWVLEGGNICTNSLSLVMMRNQQIDTNTYNDKNIMKDNNMNVNSKQDNISNMLRKDKERVREKDESGRQRGSESGGKYSLKNENEKIVKFDASVMNENKGNIEKEGEIIFQEESEEEIDGNSDEQKRKFEYYADLFQIPQNIFEILCFSVAEFNRRNPRVSARKSVRNGVGTGNLLRTFSLDADLKDVFENCFLVGRKDVFMLTTGQ